MQVFLPSSEKSTSVVMNFNGGILNKEETTNLTVHFKKIFTKQDKKISAQEKLIAIFSCGSGTIFATGRLFITTFGLYFLSPSNLIQKERKTIVLYSNMKEIVKISNPFDQSFAIVLKDTGFRITFNAMGEKRDECVETIVRLFRQFKQGPKVFGVALDSLLSREASRNNVPMIVQFLVNEISANLLDTEGIFRINSNTQHVITAVETLDRGDALEFSQFNDDEFLPCTLLKKYFRDLPEPLLGDEMFNCFEAISHSMNTIKFDEKELIRKLKHALSLLSKSHFDLAKYLFTFLSMVAFHSESNQMNSKNLATVWAPVLLRRQQQPQTQTQTDGTNNNNNNSTTNSGNNSPKTFFSSNGKQEIQTSQQRNRAGTGGTSTPTLLQNVSDDEKKKAIAHALQSLQEMSAFGGDLIRRIIDHSEQIFLSNEESED